eukprot:9464_1
MIVCKKNAQQRSAVIRICYLCCSTENIITETLPMLFPKSFNKTYGFGHRCTSHNGEYVWINSKGLSPRVDGKCGLFIDCNVETFEGFINRLYVTENTSQIDNKQDTDIVMETKENNHIDDVFATTASITSQDLTNIGKVVVKSKVYSIGDKAEEINKYFQTAELQLRKMYAKCRELYAYHISDFLFTLQLCEQYKLVQKEKQSDNKFSDLESMMKCFCVLINTREESVSDIYISFATALNVSKIN